MAKNLAILFFKKNLAQYHNDILLMYLCDNYEIR